MAKKINLDEIDESFIVAAVKKDKLSVPDNPERLLTPATIEQPEAINDEIKQPTVLAEQPKAENRIKKTGQQDYESLFICESNLPPARFGKSIYIRKEHHDRISQIVTVIGLNEVSLFGYIDNVLTHHFEIFGDDMTKLFKKKMIFK